MGKDKEQGSGQKPSGHPSSSPSEHKPKAAPQGAGAKVGCLATGCKDKDQKVGFCTEHFHQFKFGLIKKTGEPVLDYEKKLDHYAKWKKAQKVA